MAGYPSLRNTLFIISLALIGYSLVSRNVSLSAAASSAMLLAYCGMRRTDEYDGDFDLSAEEPRPKVVPQSDSIRLRESYEKQSANTQNAAVVDEMIQQGRYALLLRPEVMRNLTEEQRELATEIFVDEMAKIPAGRVQMMAAEAIGFGQGELEDEIAENEDFYLDRYAVTNNDFAEFVRDGGYDESEYWDPSIRNAIPTFVDLTGATGPRYWKNGVFIDGQADHPVVGISYYEAAAYARWAGKRLPTDPEWVQAAAAPISLSENRVQQRKYPWGEFVDEQRANLWLSGMGRSVPVTAYPAGDSVQGVRQLIGNVWEWTTDKFGCWSPWELWRNSDTEFKSIRGGAFDTYFETQATSQYQSGDHPLSRKHNIGFRCAVAVSQVFGQSHQPKFD